MKLGLCKTLSWRPHRVATAYATVCLGANLIHPVFLFYYVKVFLEHYHIEAAWFQSAQVVYMIWNAVNDPLFGYCQQSCKVSFLKTRRHTVLYGAPFLALAFLLPWFQWREYSAGDWLCGLHLTVALCLYDGLYTYVLLAGGCILNESTLNHDDRLRMVQYSQIAGLIGSSSVFICETVSEHLRDFFKFQLCCVFLALFAWLSFTYTGRNAHTLYDDSDTPATLNGTCKDPLRCSITGRQDHKEMAKGSRQDYSVCRLTWQIFTQVNFICYSIVHFMNEFHTNYITSFSSIVADTLIPKNSVPSMLLNVFFGAIILLPRVIIIFIRPLMAIQGYYRIFVVIFGLKIVVGVIVFLCGPAYFRLFMFFTLFDSTISYIAYDYSCLVRADVIDSDMKLYQRSYPLSSMFLGFNALLTKPAVALASMLGMYVLSTFSYDKYKAGDMTSSASVSDLHYVVFNLSIAFSVGSGFIQLLTWSQFRIRNSHKTCDAVS